jgi:hypothetical protein
MILLDEIGKLFTEHASAAVMKERLELAKEHFCALERKTAGLESEVKNLLSENQRLKSEVQRLTTASDADSIAHGGVRFKGLSKGSDGVELFCEKCGVALSTPPPRSSFGFTCPKCGFIASFNRNGLPSVLSRFTAKA